MVKRTATSSTNDHGDRPENGSGLKGRLYLSETWVLVLSVIALVSLVLLRNVLSAVPFALFLATFVLFMAPGVVFSGLLIKEESGWPASIPPAFVISAGLLGFPAPAAIWLGFGLEAYLIVCGVILAITLATAAVLVAQPRLYETRRDGFRFPKGRGGLLWVPFTILTFALALVSSRTYHAPNRDTWHYLTYVRNFLELPFPSPSDLGRYSVNGWILEQTALSWVSGVGPVTLVLDHLAPILIIVALLSVYWLGRVIFESEPAALLSGCLAALFFLVQMEELTITPGSEFVGRITEDKFAVRFIFLPVALGLAALFLRNRRPVYLGLFVFACWSATIVHPVALALIGIPMVGFALSHLAVNLRSGRSWLSFIAMGALTASIAVPPTAYILLSRSTVLSGLFRDNPGATERLLLSAQQNEHLLLLDEGSYIMHPALVLSPVLLVACVLGVPFLLWRLKRSLAAQVLLGTLLATLAAVYIPPLATFFGGIIEPWMLWRLAWPLPLAALLTLGWMAWELLCFLGERLPVLRSGGRASRTWHTVVPAAIVLLVSALSAPTAVAGARSLDHSDEIPQDAASCTDPVYDWMQREISKPKTVVLAPDQENSCFPAYVAGAKNISYRSFNQYGDPLTEDAGLPDNVVANRKFFDSPVFGEKMLDTARNYDIDMVLIPTYAPAAGQLEYVPGFDLMDYKGGKYRVFEVDQQNLGATPAIRANTLLNEGEFSAAVEGYTAALQGNKKEQLLAYMGLGQAYLGLKDPAAARRSLEQTVLLAPEDPTVHSLLAKAAAEDGDLLAAREALEEAVTEAPRNVELRFQLGDSEGRKERTVQKYRKVVEMFPKVPEYRAKLGGTMNLAKDYEEADEQFKQAISLNPRSASLFSVLGSTNQATGRLEKAITFYDRSLKIEPQNPVYELQIGVAYFNLSLESKGNEYSGQTEEHLLAAAKSPFSTEAQQSRAWFVLGRLHEKQRLTEKAADSYKRVLEINPGFEPARTKLDRLPKRR